MTFSLRPSSVSILPCTEASVSTRVVSWKEAAEMKLRVWSDALVIPRSTGLPSARRFLRLLQLGVDLVHLLKVDLLADEQGGIPALGDLDLLEHLADDHLDMLVVDLHALQSIDFLDLARRDIPQEPRRRAPRGCRADRGFRRSDCRRA